MSTHHSMSPWKASDHARSLVSWSRVQLDAVARTLSRSHASWADSWGVDVQGESEARMASPGDSAADGVALVHQADASLWLFESPEFASYLCHELWRVPQPLPPIAAAVTQACREDLRKVICATGSWAQVAQDEQRPPPVPLPWSGMVTVTLAPGLRLLLDGGAVRALAPAAAPFRLSHALPLQELSDVPAAMGDHALRLDVRLDACRIDIGGLRSLRVGDVLRLQHRLDKPARVQSAAGELLFHAHLVRSRGRKAVELLPQG